MDLTVQVSHGPGRGLHTSCLGSENLGEGSEPWRQRTSCLLWRSLSAWRAVEAGLRAYMHGCWRWWAAAAPGARDGWGHSQGPPLQSLCLGPAMSVLSRKQGLCLGAAASPRAVLSLGALGPRGADPAQGACSSSRPRAPGGLGWGGGAPGRGGGRGFWGWVVEGEPRQGLGREVSEPRELWLACRSEVRFGPSLLSPPRLAQKPA